MNFLLPRRTLQRIKKIGEANSLAIPLQDIEKALESYNQAIKDYSILRSWIPGTYAYAMRKKLVSTIDELQVNQELAQALNDSNKKTYLSIALFPSWKKTIAVALISIVLIALALTGVGALAGLGIFGTVAAGFIISKVALMVVSFVAAKLAISTVSLAAITTGISSFLASFTLSEWLEPGKLYNNFIRSERAHSESNKAILQLDKNSKEPIRQLLIDCAYIVFFPIWLIPITILNVVIMINASSELKYEQIDREYAEYLLKLSFNPLRWVELLLRTVERILFRILETSSKQGAESNLPLRITKGFINGLFQLIITPIQLLQPIGDIPYEVVKFVAYTVSKALWKGNKDVDEKVKDQKPMPSGKETTSTNNSIVTNDRGPALPPNTSSPINTTQTLLDMQGTPSIKTNSSPDTIPAAGGNPALNP